MAFTNEEMAILSQLSYKNLKRGDRLYDQVYRLITNPTNNQERKLSEEYKSVLEGLLKKTKGKDYVVVKSVNNDVTGFQAFAIKDPNNEVTVACRGTEGFDVLNSNESVKDVMYGDLALLNSRLTPQQAMMYNFMRELETNASDYGGPFEGYYFTGHSLGGNVATHGAITFTPPNKVKGVVTFNAPGFSDDYLKLYAPKILLLNDKMIHYQNEYDVVSSIFLMPGKIIIVDSQLDSHSLDDHSIYAFKVGDNGKFSKKEVQIKQPVTYGVTGLTQYADKNELDAAKIVGGILCLFVVARFVKDFYGFSKEKIEELRKNLNPTDGYINVDTWLLRDYANSLEKINKKLKNIDSRLNKFYLDLSVDLGDKMTILKADLKVNGEYTLLKCINYLRDTAYDFEQAERNIKNEITNLKV